jgi:transcriptional regulator with XRE-family HTH domain
MANVREIAKNLGVSVATVSRALNDKPNVRPDTRERILAEASRIGYDFVRPATAPKVIGLAYTSYQGHLDYGGFDSALMAGVLRGVEEQRYDINIISIHRDKTPNEDFRTFFRRKGVAGVILRTFQGSRHLCEEIADEGFPAVVVADRFDNPKVNFTCTESRLQSQRAVEHLIHLGHTRIGLGVHRVRDTDHQDRCDGYRDALEKHGLEFDPVAGGGPGGGPGGRWEHDQLLPVAARSADGDLLHRPAGDARRTAQVPGAGARGAAGSVDPGIRRLERPPARVPAVHGGVPGRDGARFRGGPLAVAVSRGLPEGAAASHDPDDARDQ